MTVYAAVVTISHPSIGGTGTNTWHMRVEDENDQEAGVDDCMQQVSEFYTDIRDFFPNNLTWRWDGTAVGVGPDEGALVEGTPFSQTGSVAGGPMPPANCIVLGWRTALAGRSGKGRTFLGPLATTTLDGDGSIDIDALTAFRAAGTALVAASQSLAQMALGVWSPTDGVIRDFTGSAVRDQFAVLRSRRD